MALAAFILSVVGFVLSLGAVALAVLHVVDLKSVSRLQAEISVIQVYMARELESATPDLLRLRRLFLELADRSSRLLGSEQALVELVGTLEFQPPAEASRQR